MIGGQVTLNSITDAQLEALLDVKKNNEGQFVLLNLLPVNPPFQPPPSGPWYGPGSPWGMGPGLGVYYGPGSPHGLLPPGWPPPALPTPQPGSPSTYNVTLSWQSDQGLKAVSAVLDRLPGAT